MNDHFNCDIRIVDMIMGSGKSSAAINYMNNAPDDEKFIYISPLMEEANRIVDSCSQKHFVTPEKRFTNDTKLRNIKYLVDKGYNIASTHALFHRFDRKMIEMCQANNYTLVMDEVTDVISEYPLSQQDLEILLEKYIYVEEETHLLKWNRDMSDYNGKFATEKRLCDMNCLAYYGKSVAMCLFPIDVFNAFRKVFILTYMFDAQIQKYYYDYFKLPYSYLFVEGNHQEGYKFTDSRSASKPKYDYGRLIHIEEHAKLNSIGNRHTDLSKAWYDKNANSAVMKQLKNNILNFFMNIHNAKSDNVMWTTFKDYRTVLKGKGYTKGYLASNCRSINSKRNTHYIAYTINKYMNPLIKNFFISHDIDVDEDGFALSEMLQFIWRSAIREGEEIWIYIPSIRMRNLLKKWIQNNSPIQEGRSNATI